MLLFFLSTISKTALCWQSERVFQCRDTLAANREKENRKINLFSNKRTLGGYIYCDCMRQADQVPEAGAAGGPGPDADPHHQRQHSPQHQGRLPLPALRSSLTLVPYQVPYSAQFIF